MIDSVKSWFAQNHTLVISAAQGLPSAAFSA
jgi:hypothetical protein